MSNGKGMNGYGIYGGACGIVFTNRCCVTKGITSAYPQPPQPHSHSHPHSSGSEGHREAGNPSSSYPSPLSHSGTGAGGNGVNGTSGTTGSAHPGIHCSNSYASHHSSTHDSPYHSAVTADSKKIGHFDFIERDLGALILCQKRQLLSARRQTQWYRGTPSKKHCVCIHLRPFLPL
ncbi:uncharacterized protein EI90DRAFT_2685519 [Cantharellus anzutake]|uniref:uncharacterized protein n=1 Tax=Cantharellus anzutake TaxID=1750568 RepID=UPI001908B447|nr:uncharacterized protein EI90DRAFT_2685519 [Cantharellus anzutake]KAF8319184.1 hypothetical protein EI90DRAFT_2685519 [Cantharellus anzutake]